jgi:hypothetical protein
MYLASTQNTATPALSSNPFYVLAMNDDGSAISQTNGAIKGWWAGAGLTAAQQQVMYNALGDYFL